MSPAQIVQKLWNYCNVLRDDGMSYGDYVEQLTYLLFLKMAHERSKPPYNLPSPVPKKYDWQGLLKKDGDELFDHYRHLLEELGKKTGLLGLIFGRAQNKFQDPAKLRRLIVDLINKEDWSSMSADVKGDAYEGLLEKNAQDTKSGAGQYFTPRPLIEAMVDVISPKPKETICDPACGTGGFLLASHKYIADRYKLNKEEKRFLDNKALKGWELVHNTARLCAMNMMLHGIGGDLSAREKQAGELPLFPGVDSLASHPGDYFDVVLTNPPFGKKSSTTIIGVNGKPYKEKET
ncbi:MAG: class I SAM-dependent DNA methyltransferase, partial [Nitrospinota bacterium]